MEANWFRPTLDVIGMFGGYTGEGVKTVIPAQAKAKITCRLVLNQNPQKVLQAVGTFLEKQVKTGMKIQVDLLGGVGAFRGSADSKVAQAIARAGAEVVGKPCHNILSGGSIPVVADLARLLQTQVVGMGYGLITDSIHAPNEHFDWARFEKGFLTIARAIEYV